jgi:hypothetical protein
MATKQLPGVIPLLKDSWKFFTSKWNDSLKITIWLVYIGLVQLALTLLSTISPFFTFIYIPAEAAVLVVSLWVGVRILQVMLDLEAGKKPSYSKDTANHAFRLILPLLWIGALNLLIVFGGTVLFILPGIYFAIVLSFSNFFLIEDGAHGTAALAKSRDLVKGRFWATTWRLLAGGFVFFVGTTFILSILFTLIALVAGPQHLVGLSSDASYYELSPLAQGTIDLLQAIVQAALMPLIAAYVIKLYRALRRTQ